MIRRVQSLGLLGSLAVVLVAGVVRADGEPDPSSQAVSLQSISAPKGEGTIQGLGDAFTTLSATGSALLTLPIPLPHARGAAQPSLALSYASGGSDGTVGVGFAMEAPFIARDTSHGVPRYAGLPGRFDPDQDRFVLNGSSELVPLCVVGGAGCAAVPDEPMPPWASGWMYFRPRIEGAFQRFFWSPDGRTWRVEDKAGTTLELGVPLDGGDDANALETDPADRTRAFRWNAARHFDGEGEGLAASASGVRPRNVVVYRYASDAGIAYLTDVYDTPPAASPETAPLALYAHHARLTYEARPDVLTSFKRGYATVMARRLAGVDVTSVEAGGAGRALLRRVHLGYDRTDRVSLLTEMVVEGRCAAPVQEDDGGALPATDCPRLPPVTLSYTRGGREGGRASPFHEFGSFETTTQPLAPSPRPSLASRNVDFLDIDGDALPDLVQTESTSGAPEHGVFFNGKGGVPLAFAAVTPLGMAADAAMGSDRLAFKQPDVVPLDLDGDARVDLVYMPQGPTSRVFDALRTGGAWKWTPRLVPTPHARSGYLDLTGGRKNARTLDVDADGLVDLVVTEGTKIHTYFALGRYPGGDGRFGTARWTSPTTADIVDAPFESCSPGDDQVVDLSQRDVLVADMNGDGIQDLVRFGAGRLQYWPGRGNGTWGSVLPLACDPRRAAGTHGEVRMIAAPAVQQGPSEVVRLVDANGDGLDDVVHVVGKTVEVYFNIAGVSFYPQPMRLVLDDMGATPPPDVVRLIDVNGSGTPDVVWGSAGAYRFLDLLGGARPRLLSSVDTGRGKVTEVTYAPTTRVMLAAEAAGSPWQTRMPIVTQVVTRVVTKNLLAVAGRPADTWTVDYTYRDPVYEPRQREFRGFREVLERRSGDASTPASTTRTLFLSGECVDETPADDVDDCAPAGRFRDNGREALKGLPVVSETFDDAGVYLSTSHRSYTLRGLATGLDGRAVRHAFLAETNVWAYDVAAFAPGTSTTEVADVVLDGVGGATRSRTLPLRSDAGRAHTRSASTVDRHGNAIASRADGCVDGCGGVDESILTVSESELAPGSDWLWRTTRSWTEGSSAPGRRHEKSFELDARGHVVVTRAVLSGSLPLDRFHAVQDRAVAPPPPEAAADGVIVVSATDYDDFGNPAFQRAAGNKCRSTLYDAPYAIAPSVEMVHVGALGADAGRDGSRASAAFAATPEGSACGSTLLPGTATYDRGFEIATEVTGLHGETTRTELDGFGRVTRMWRPDASRVGTVSDQPSLTIAYDLDPTGRRPYEIVQTRALDGASSNDPSFHESWAYVDGLGRTVVTLDEADPGAGDGGRWVVKGLTDFDQKGSPRRVFLPWFSDADPATYSLDQAPAAAFTGHRYDAFGREIEATDTAGEISLATVHHALSTEAWDAADLRSASHRGTFSSATKDGHGRVVVSADRVMKGGAVEVYETRTAYLCTGETASITRVHAGSSDAPVVRWMRYDSLGRMVMNADAHTSKGFRADGAVDPAQLKTWRYAYDGAGAMVGTSDARGCGVNLHRDAGGRVVAEDVSPCLESHPLYTAPDLATGDGTEAFYRYDSPEPDASPGCVQNASTLLGRLSSTSDRGGRLVTSYDGLGRTACVARRIVKPREPPARLSERYATDWFVQRMEYDAQDRLVRETTGATAPELLGDEGTSMVSSTYTKRGLVGGASSSYGDLVTGVTHDADGLLQSVAYADAAKTLTVHTYDAKRRLATAQTYRGAAPAWSSPVLGVTPAGTQQHVLEDTAFVYDEVGNPVEIQDQRIADEWPAGAKPVSRRMAYDDLYRLVDIRYAHASGDDAWVSPFDAEDHGVADPRRERPSPHQSFDHRARAQGYAFDWLGNTTQTTDDDAHGFWDRSLGDVTNGTDRPYQLRDAKAPTGSLHATYDDGGYLVGLTVVRDGPCLPALAVCAQRYAYDWDELGNLVRGRRWDEADPGAPGDAVPTRAPDAELRFAYDASAERVLKTVVDGGSGERHVVYALTSLELRGATFDGEGYARTAYTEVPYLYAHGVRLGRVVQASDDSGAPPRRRVFLEINDEMGSSSTVVDLETSELVERATYLAYGAVDSDYRPARWESFREDRRFTGKEEDVELGIQYFGKRYYAPSLGRWLSADPLAVHSPGRADLNLYAYVHGRVMQAVDVLGLDDVMIVPQAPVDSRGAAVTQAQLDRIPHNTRDADGHFIGPIKPTNLEYWKKTSSLALSDFGTSWSTNAPGRKLIVMPTDAGTEVATAKIDQAAAAAGRGGSVYLAVDHGSAQGANSDAGFTLWPSSKTPFAARTGETIRQSTVTAGTRDAYGTLTTGSAGDAKMATVLDRAKQSFAKYGVARFGVVTCNVGTSTALMKGLGNRLGVEVTGYAHYLELGRQDGQMMARLTTKTDAVTAYSRDLPVPKFTVSSKDTAH